ARTDQQSDGSHGAAALPAAAGDPGPRDRFLPPAPRGEAGRLAGRRDDRRLVPGPVLRDPLVLRRLPALARVAQLVLRGRSVLELLLEPRAAALHLLGPGQKSGDAGEAGDRSALVDRLDPAGALVGGVDVQGAPMRKVF